VTAFLRVASGLAAALGRLQARGLSHKYVKPGNILVNAATGEVWLTGFDINVARAARARCDSLRAAHECAALHGHRALRMEALPHREAADSRLVQRRGVSLARELVATSATESALEVRT
jgi:hypothetical protein